MCGWPLVGIQLPRCSGYITLLSSNAGQVQRQKPSYFALMRARQRDAGSCRDAGFPVYQALSSYRLTHKSIHGHNFVPVPVQVGWHWDATAYCHLGYANASFWLVLMQM